ncbi:MAG: hypothetical protein HY902_09955 [Deltaproteobacteria bacterium]|nr:hypothetical protein [Deltaproteobacteria bacterium]
MNPALHRIAWTVVAARLAAPAAADEPVDRDAWQTIGRAWFRAGDGPLRGAEPPAEYADCGRCHARIAAEWRGSLHGNAWSDPLFQVSYRREPEPFCRSCHAPLSPEREPSGAAARDGISCAVCHVRGGEIYGSRARARDPAGHAVQASKDLANPGFCGGCHQFGFFVLPERRGVARFEGPYVQQATFAEWADSRQAKLGLRCHDCHMPPQRADGGEPWRSHAFPGADSDLLLQAVQVQAQAHATAEGTQVEFTVTNRAGHAYPTGDLFRRALLEVRPTGTPNGDAELRQYLFTRVFIRATGASPTHGPWTSNRIADDTRLQAGETRRLTWLLPRTERIQWVLWDDKMPTPDPRQTAPSSPTRRRALARGEIAVQ